jgi:hypothetical protein
VRASATRAQCATHAAPPGAGPPTASDRRRWAPGGCVLRVTPERHTVSATWRPTPLVRTRS